MILFEGAPELGYPLVKVRVRRAAGVRARYQDQFGEWRETILSGLQARVFQHELDHLDGRTLATVVRPEVFEEAKRRAGYGQAA